MFVHFCILVPFLGGSLVHLKSSCFSGYKAMFHFSSGSTVTTEYITCSCNKQFYNTYGHWCCISAADADRSGGHWGCSSFACWSASHGSAIDSTRTNSTGGGLYCKWWSLFQLAKRLKAVPWLFCELFKRPHLHGMISLDFFHITKLHIR